jgi:hypothetical protein
MDKVRHGAYKPEKFYLKIVGIIAQVCHLDGVSNVRKWYVLSIISGTG